MEQQASAKAVQGNAAAEPCETTSENVEIIKVHPNLRMKLGYGMGDFAYNLTWTLAASFLTYFYTDVFLIPAAAVSVIFLVMSLVDSITDPIIGMMADRTNTRWGRYRPWVMFSMIGLVGALMLMFWAHPEWPDYLKIIYAAATYYLGTVMSTASNMPYGAMAAVITQDQNERATFSSWRMGLAMAGGCILTFFFLNWVNAFGGAEGNLVQGYLLAVLAIGAIGIAITYFVFRNTKEVIKNPVPPKLDVKRELRMAFKNKPLMLLTVSFFIFGIILYGRMAVMVYYFTYNVGDAGLFSIFYPVTVGIGLIGNFGASPIMRRVNNKKMVAILGMIFAAVGFGMLFFVDFNSNMVLFYILGCIGSIGQGFFFSAIYGMIPDCGEYAMWMNGKRSDGFLYSFTSILMKWGHAIIGAATTAVLAAMNYVPNVAQPANVLTAINVLMCVVPGVLCAINIIPLAMYRIDRKVFNRICADINSGNIGKGEKMPGI